jgi:CRP/FNR family cyclic AMP-dependent transcriptional regulator
MADLSTSTLPAVGWISQLKEDDRAILSSYGEFIPAHPDKPVIKEGDSQTNLYFVISGSLKVKHSGQKGEHVIASIKAGESFGEISVFDPGPASATVIAFEFSQLWRINQDELLSFIRDNPAVGNQILIALTTLLSQRLRRLDPVLVNFIDRHIETSA